MAEPPARQRTLEQFDSLGLFFKIFKGHARFKLEVGLASSGNFHGLSAWKLQRTRPAGKQNPTAPGVFSSRDIVPAPVWAPDCTTNNRCGVLPGFRPRCRDCSCPGRQNSAGRSRLHNTAPKPVRSPAPPPDSVPRRLPAGKPRCSGVNCDGDFRAGPGLIRQKHHKSRALAAGL